MSLFNTLKEKLKEKFSKDSAESQVQSWAGVDEYETRDNYLRSLRRQHRRVMDEHEKKALQQTIDEHYRKKYKSWISETDTVLNYNTYKTPKPKKSTFFGKGNL